MDNKKRKRKLISVPKNKKKVKNKVEYTRVNTEKLKPNKPKKYISKKRKRRRNRILLTFSLTLILCLTLGVLSVTVFFPIKSIKIVGAEKYTAEQISSSIGVIEGDNLILASEKRAENSVRKSLNYVKKIEFKKKFPFTLEVRVNEYSVYSQIKFNDEYIRIGDDGIVLETVSEFDKSSPEIKGVTPTAYEVGSKIEFKEDGNDPILSKIDKILKSFSDSGMDKITLINFENMHDIRVTYNNRIVMLLGSDSNLEQKLTHAKATLKSRANSSETGTLNLSRIPGSKNVASFIPGKLEKSEIAGK